MLITITVLVSNWDSPLLNLLVEKVEKISAMKDTIDVPVVIVGGGCEDAFPSFRCNFTD